jgi:hypothetical protein
MSRRDYTRVAFEAARGAAGVSEHEFFLVAPYRYEPIVATIAERFATLG